MPEVVLLVDGVKPGLVPGWVTPGLPMVEGVSPGLTLGWVPPGLAVEGVNPGLPGAAVDGGAPGLAPGGVGVMPGLAVVGVVVFPAMGAAVGVICLFGGSFCTCACCAGVSGLVALVGRPAPVAPLVGGLTAVALGIWAVNGGTFLGAGAILGLPKLA